MAATIFNRYIWLVDLIARKKRITLKEINYEWLRASITDNKPIPDRTFHNHRDAIEETFDINIACDKSSNEYYIENTEDIEHDSIRKWLLNTFAVNNLVSETKVLRNRIQFENIPSGQQYLTTIIEAMRDSRKLEVTYHSYWSEPGIFDVEPYFVKVFKQRWYLIGKSDRVRIYALDRITDLKFSEQAFNMPNGFSPDDFFENCYGIILGEDMIAEKVQLRIGKDQAKYIRALPLHYSQIEKTVDNECVVFEYYIKPTFDFIQEILLHGDFVEVLSPESLRNEVKQIAGRMNEMYSR